MEPVLIDELQLTTGIDIPVEGLGVTLRQPKICDIAILGEQKYFMALSIFGLTTKTLRIQTPDATNWMVFQQTLNQKIEGVKNMRTFMTNFLQLFFNEKVNLGPRSIMIQTPGEIKNIEPEDFDYFQYLVGLIGGSKLLTPVEEKFKPKNKKAAEIAEKMKKARKRLAKVKAAQNGTADQENKGFLARYIRVAAIASPNSMSEINNLTLLQLNDIVQTYLAKEAYDLEIKSRLAGAKGDKELVHWMMRDPNGQDNDSIGRI